MSVFFDFVVVIFVCFVFICLLGKLLWLIGGEFMILCVV